MADQSYPQIPTTVWWGMRTLLQKTPSAKFDESMLAAQLSVQPAAARQYVAELKKVGILDEEGRCTDLANKWRMDETYADAVNELASAVYPEQLVTISPPGEANRQKVKNWFMTQGLGEGSANNKAATYMLITNSSPGESAPARAQSNGSGTKRPSQSTVKKPTKQLKGAPKSADSGQGGELIDALPLNVNVQIHISADASADQIDAIFSAMRKYRIG